MKHDIKDLINQIDDHLSELELIDRILSTNTNSEFLRAIANDAFEDAQRTIVHGYWLLDHGK